jgi:hypothetical protein
VGRSGRRRVAADLSERRARGEGSPRGEICGIHGSGICRIHGGVVLPPRDPRPDPRRRDAPFLCLDPRRRSLPPSDPRRSTRSGPPATRCGHPPSVGAAGSCSGPDPAQWRDVRLRWRGGGACANPAGGGGARANGLSGLINGLNGPHQRAC